MPVDSEHPSVQRKHVTIMFTDIAGYTALMGSDEDRAFEVLRKNRNIHNRYSLQFNGKIIKEIGDGMLLSFELPSDAVRCAMKIQEASKNDQIPLKIGIHDGEVIFEGKDVFGDGVNVSSRIQALATEGSIYVSGSVCRNVKNKADINTKFIEEKSLKNVDELIKVYQIVGKEYVEDKKPKTARGKTRINRNQILLSVVILLAVISGLLIWQNYYSNNDINLERSIAVLPFSNESLDEGNIYFVNGMMEDIRNNLANIGDLRVVSKTSTDKYREASISLYTIAKELEVNYLLEGSVQKLDNNVKIHAQLINAETDDHLWSETYTREIGDVFGLQYEIAQSIAKELRAVITPEEKKIIERKPTDNNEAYDLYLRGREFYYRGSSADLGNAIYFFKKALDLDPEFALAYVWLGMAHFEQSGMKDYLKENYADTIKYFAEKAIALDSNQSEGYRLRAEYFWLKTDFDSCFVDAVNAARLNPNNGQAYKLLGLNYYFDKKDFINAFANLEKARKLIIGDLDQYPEILDAFATAYMAIGHFGGAHLNLEELKEYKPMESYFNLWILNLAKGYNSKSQLYLDSLCALDSSSCKWPMVLQYVISGQVEKFEPEKDHLQLFELAEPTWKAYILSELNRKEEAEEYFKQSFDFLNKTIELRRLHGVGGQRLYELAAQFCYLGEKEKSYTILQNMEERKILEGWMVWMMGHDPRFESIREEAKFTNIINRQEKEYTDIRATLDSITIGLNSPTKNNL